MSDPINWISDALHDILGLSDDTTIVRFLISLSKGASSMQQLEKQLLEQDLIPNGEASHRLVERLY